MLSEWITERLSVITDEEKLFLSGGEVKREHYMANKDIVTAGKLLDKGHIIAIRPHTRFVHFPPHTHDYVEVIFMCKGETIHILNGENVVLKEGELLFLSRRVTQEIMPASENDIAVNFIIRPHFFNETLEMLGEEETPLRRFLADSLEGGERGPEYLHFKVSGAIEVQNLMENLILSFLEPPANRQRIRRLTMGLLFLSLIEHTELLSAGGGDFLISVMRYIEENYRDASLSDLADILHRDRSYLSREIKNRTGKTFTDFLQEKRLSQAAYLLKNAKMSVSAAAEAVGYENLSYFHRIFRARFGVTPHKYK